MTAKITVQVDPLTYAILHAMAVSYKLEDDELVAQMIYRDCATASGWPGQLGGELRRVVRDYQFPDRAAEEEVPF